MGARGPKCFKLGKNKEKIGKNRHLRTFFGHLSQGSNLLFYSAPNPENMDYDFFQKKSYKKVYVWFLIIKWETHKNVYWIFITLDILQMFLLKNFICTTFLNIQYNEYILNFGFRNFDSQWKNVKSIFQFRGNKTVK